MFFEKIEVIFGVFVNGYIDLSELKDSYDVVIVGLGGVGMIVVL